MGDIKHIPGGQTRVLYQALMFLFLKQNIWCGYSKEPSQWDASFEHPNHMFKQVDMENQGISSYLNPLLVSILNIMLYFITGRIWVDEWRSSWFPISVWSWIYPRWHNWWATSWGDMWWGDVWWIDALCTIICHIPYVFLLYSFPIILTGLFNKVLSKDSLHLTIHKCFRIPIQPFLN